MRLTRTTLVTKPHFNRQFESFRFNEDEDEYGT